MTNTTPSRLTYDLRDANPAMADLFGVFTNQADAPASATHTLRDAEVPDVPTPLDDTQVELDANVPTEVDAGAQGI